MDQMSDLGGPEASGACAPALESSLARGVCWSLNVTLFGRPGVGDAEPFVWHGLASFPRQEHRRQMLQDPQDPSTIPMHSPRH
jgi:hypothetical protein